jgi:hypothetical protein
VVVAVVTEVCESVVLVTAVVVVKELDVAVNVVAVTDVMVAMQLLHKTGHAILMDGTVSQV